MQALFWILRAEQRQLPCPHGGHLPAYSADVGRGRAPWGWKASFKINVKVRSGAQAGEPNL